MSADPRLSRIEQATPGASSSSADDTTELWSQASERPMRFDKPRLPRMDYIGERTYHVTLVTPLRSPLFEDVTVGRKFEAILVSCSEKLGFSLLAYCFMPDHLHVLLRGVDAKADLLRFVQRFKQETGFYFKALSGDRPWQQSFFDRVLREADDPMTVARYISNNPAKEGLPIGHPAYLLRGGELFVHADAEATANAGNENVGTKLQLRPNLPPDGAEASSLHSGPSSLCSVPPSHWPGESWIRGAVGASSPNLEPQVFPPQDPNGDQQ